MAPGGCLQFLLKDFDDIVVGIDHCKIKLHDLSHLRIREVLIDTDPVALKGNPAADLWQIVLDCRIVHMSQEIGPSTDQKTPAAEQIAGRPHLGRIDISHREHAAAQQAGNLLGVDLVVLHLATMHSFHVQGMAEDKLNTFATAEIGKPVPGEHTLDADHQVIPERSNDLEEIFRRRGNVAVYQHHSVSPQNADEHFFRMKIDSAVMFVGFCVKSHL